MFTKKNNQQSAANILKQSQVAFHKHIPGKPCHTDGTSLFRWEAIEFFAGRYLGVNTNKYDLIIDMSGIVKPNAKITGESPAVAEFLQSKFTPVVSIDWPDYGIINWVAEDYKNFLRAIRADNVRKVYVCCVGGHGRTGTMISILAAITGNVLEGECPVEIIRKKYCQFAVESLEQIQYIEFVTGFTVKSNSSKPLNYNAQGAYGTLRAPQTSSVPSVEQYNYLEDVTHGYWRNRYDTSSNYPASKAEKVYDGYYKNPKASS